MKFKLKRYTVDAARWTGENPAEIIALSGDADYVTFNKADGSVVIEHEGGSRVTAQKGWYVIADNGTVVQSIPEYAFHNLYEPC